MECTGVGRGRVGMSERNELGSDAKPRAFGALSPDPSTRYITIRKTHAELHSVIANSIIPHLQRPSNDYAWGLCQDLCDLMLVIIGPASEFGWHLVSALPPATPGLAAELERLNR